MPLLLRHVHLPGITPYLRAAEIQEQVVRAFLDHKSKQGKKGKKTTKPGPPPFLLTFQASPAYTCGRREIGKLTPAQIDYLKNDGKAEFHEALRGGQTTFHGPGQLTAYLVCSLQEHGLDTRGYIELLQNSAIDVCKTFRLDAQTTVNPGVWIGQEPEERKLASVGVHLRRNITSHGIGLNVDVDLSWFNRIDACGLPEKKATSIKQELKKRGQPHPPNVKSAANFLSIHVYQRLPNVRRHVNVSEEEALQEIYGERR
ncbi:hypothetical protein MMC21_002331 [Puttea exsequens]|nr:hypothetical protein [Puttea exsequens]